MAWISRQKVYHEGGEILQAGDKVPESVGRAFAPYCSHLRYRR